MLSVANDGTFGTGFWGGGLKDFFTGDRVLSCEFPRGAGTNYLWGGAFWIGAVIGSDTLVSTGHDGWQQGAEFNTDVPPLGDMIYRSTVDPSKPEFAGAVSEQDYIAVYYDTCLNCPGVTTDPEDGRPHKPLHVEITQRSYAWSYEYAEDFVLFDYEIKNIGNDRLNNVYMGVYIDADVRDRDIDWTIGAEDDICGYQSSIPTPYLPSACAPDSDHVGIAWLADNNGDLDLPGQRPAPNVTGARIVRTPHDSLDVSFNWWLSNSDASWDFGPQTKAGVRDFGTGGLGTPEGDRNKYHVLRNGEFDYNQTRIASITSLDPVWLVPPEEFVTLWATGLDVRFLLSFGPFQVEPGQTLPISFAYVAGEGFHSDPDNFDNLPDNWQSFEAGLDFSDLGKNAIWAGWVYDNPGVDTDGDDYFGEFTLCSGGGDSTLVVDTIWDSQVVPPIISLMDSVWLYEYPDTIWRTGDGVPDFRGAAPPPAPAYYTVNGRSSLRVTTGPGQIRLVWNGLRSETTRDVFLQDVDFEGYRVYFARDERPESFVVLASYDREDYNKFIYDDLAAEFVLRDPPFSIDELRDLYADGDTTWHPLTFTRSRPFMYSGPGFDSALYFAAQDYNLSVFGNYPGAQTEIRKVYPDATYPTNLNPDSLTPQEQELYLTEDGFFKYFEYEYTIRDLLATVPYWVNVTSFDFGSPRSGVPPQETDPSLGAVVTYALESGDAIQSGEVEIYVYPNPYRINANYAGRGFEGRVSDVDPEKDRRVHFANLPPRCKISIFTLDGDLVREIHHDVDPGDPLSNHATWDLITRNRQQIVSGLYYWVVESSEGHTQTGKLVVIF